MPMWRLQKKKAEDHAAACCHDSSNSGAGTTLHVNAVCVQRKESELEQIWHDTEQEQAQLDDTRTANQKLLQVV